MKLYKAIRFLMLSGILTLVLSRCIRESLEGCPLDTLLRRATCYDLPTSLAALPLTFSESVFRG